jgi:glycosyltransferase involved in cell wall biosynthesis
MPKISIITINYNNLAGLKKTVESVVNQTWHEFEYIVIDGGSTDGSSAYIESQSEHFDYWVSEPDKGIYNAMNKGIAKATGEYLLFLNSGDHLFSETVLEENHSSITNYDLVYFDIQIVDESGAKTSMYPEKLRFSDLYFKSLPHLGTFIKRSLFETVGLYDENLKIVSDWKFFIMALFKHNCTYSKTKGILSTFYMNGISAISDFSEERNKVLQENFSEYIIDYEQWNKHQKVLNTNRFKMLSEIEKTFVGKKAISFIFRTYIILFSKKKLKKILKG